MEAAFAWARDMKPIQPLTTGAWTDFNSPFSHRMMELSDVVSFHGYDPVPEIEAKLKICAAYGRPVLCTEWLVRRDGNSFERLLPLFRDRKIGCWNWGLVAGRTQTYFPWGSPQGAPEPKQWQHDILRADGAPFNARRDPVHQGDHRQVARQCPAPANSARADGGEIPSAVALHAGETGRRLVQAGLRRRCLEARRGPVRHGRTALRPQTQHGLDQHRHLAAPRIRYARRPGSPTWRWCFTTTKTPSVYINGVLAVKADGYNAAYESFDISPEARVALKPGRNLHRRPLSPDRRRAISRPGHRSGRRKIVEGARGARRAWPGRINPLAEVPRRRPFRIRSTCRCPGGEIPPYHNEQPTSRPYERARFESASVHRGRLHRFPGRRDLHHPARLRRRHQEGRQAGDPGRRTRSERTNPGRPGRISTTSSWTRW